MTPWTVARQVPLSVGFSRQAHWRGSPCPPQGDLPSPGVEPVSLESPALQADSLSSQSHLGSHFHPQEKAKEKVEMISVQRVSQLTLTSPPHPGRGWVIRHPCFTHNPSGSHAAALTQKANGESVSLESHTAREPGKHFLTLAWSCLLVHTQPTQTDATHLLPPWSPCPVLPIFSIATSPQDLPSGQRAQPNSRQLGPGGFRVENLQDTQAFPAADMDCFLQHNFKICLHGQTLFSKFYSKPPVPTQKSRAEGGMSPQPTAHLRSPGGPTQDQRGQGPGQPLLQAPPLPRHLFGPQGMTMSGCFHQGHT